MYRYILEDARHVLPFNEPASKLVIGTATLSFHHDEIFSQVFKGDLKLGDSFQLAGQMHNIREDEPAFVYRDSLWFDSEFVRAFIKRAQASGKACQAAIFTDEKERAFTAYTLPLSTTFETVATDAQSGRPIAMVDMWYFPKGYTKDALPIAIDSQSVPLRVLQCAGFYGAG
jgi:hypothetical protein